MLRVFATLALPLLLPAVIYLCWMRLMHPATRGGGTGRLAGMPWAWLAGAGMLLLAIVLIAIRLNFGTPLSGTYIPPRWDGDRVVPGHVEPGSAERPRL
jgi:hypothetical protein